jgi:predicted small secreted protein
MDSVRDSLFVGCLLVLAAGLLTSCQTLREVASLKDVQFRIDRATDAQLAGINLEGVRSYEDLGGADVARLGAALSSGELPLSFTLHVAAENPSTNSVDARLTRMDWTLLLNDQETIAGTFDREVVLPPGTPKDVPVDIKLDLIDFFDQNLRGLVDLATAVGGEGPPTDVSLRVQPTVRTPLGRMKYPTPITVVSRQVGADEAE